ncbi:hypothetical protein PP175_25700 (plasmid) [Aneurinibacillus sp. Ricciae_BoGa-3]|uniref:hypothetical protein n=1 Tax=Aneurinibacillus sp. Ricciae_BoGa-3 TaxID=3022697 RepID=UPI00233FDCD9|nr:hypothetical protein [Aneurinibacillus sp. Ricciae_BoGa-3]WCK57464.1 hypothetical protein PP175_25700 [Aneurinibacillus sp. Ricciae_BoGa-3]
MNREKAQRIKIVLIAVGVIVVGGMIIGVASHGTKKQPVPIPTSVQSFDSANMLGSIKQYNPVGQWFKGEKGIISSTHGQYDVYMENGQLKGVWDSVTKQPLLNQTTSNQQQIDGSVNGTKYQVINESVPSNREALYGTILIPNFDKSTMSPVQAEQLCKAILDKEHLDEGSFYMNQEAYSADTDKAYNDAHPDVLKTGMIGIYQNGQFKNWQTLGF